MTEGEEIGGSAGELLALNPQQEEEFKKRVQEVKKRPPKRGALLNPGVIYVGHLPSGLFEDKLKKYFQQFGTITRLRLARSKKTGGSKGYAFVEYECDDVARIVAETMNNYLMGERLIKCQVVPPEKIHEKLFVGSVRKFRKPSNPAVKRYNKEQHTQEEVDKMTDKLIKKEKKLRKRLAAQGIDYDFPGFAAQKRSLDEMNASSCSNDVTPLCTPSVLEKRRLMEVGEDDGDDEIVLKMPTAVTSSEDEEEEESEGDDERSHEEDGAENDEPSEGDKTVTE